MLLFQDVIVHNAISGTLRGMELQGVKTPAQGYAEGWVVVCMEWRGRRGPWRLSPLFFSYIR
jgi:predicted alpha/beta-fold hydrolase